MRLRPIRMMLLSTLVLALAATCIAQSKPWEKEYTGKDATGEHILGLWQFKPGAEGKDNSGHGHNLRLRDKAKYVKGGKFGSCLESFLAGGPLEKTKYGASTRSHPRLNPQGSFTLEAWFKPKPEMAKARTAFIVDKKFYHYAKAIPRANTGYMLFTTRVSDTQRKFVASLGFGKDSVFMYSDVVTVKPGTWYHIAFTYNGHGIARMFFDGKQVNKTVMKGRDAITPSPFDFTIGDRYGSSYVGFPGYIDQVRLMRGIPGSLASPLTVDVRGGRTTFVRMEKDKSMDMVIDNESDQLLRNVTATIALKTAKPRTYPLGTLAPSTSKVIKVPIDTTLRPDAYTYKVVATGTLGATTVHAEKSGPLTIVARPLPKRMPVIMWGGGDIKNLTEIGFTHKLHTSVDYARIWNAGKPTQATVESRAASYRAQLDELLANGIGAAVYPAPGRYIMKNKALHEKYKRVDRNGKAAGHNGISASHPDVVKFCYNVGASIAQTFGDHPGLQASLIHSEIRGSTALCFQPWSVAQWKAYSGTDVPAQAVGKAGLSYTAIKGFPSNRIVPDDMPLLRFYRWFWSVGDGWNELHTQVSKGLKSTGRDDIITWYDPAVRVPSRWGSGGDIDVISQWTYTYPDPIKIGQSTDELFAMADGRPGQKVMKMTQVIWYRRQTAPKLPKDKSTWAQWEKDLPEAAFVTISPDFMREALWVKMSRPVQGIMYHGWGSLVAGVTRGSYRYTHPKSRVVLAELVRSVVRPLGPALMQVPEAPRKVALLQSFTSQMFANRGTWGWSGKWDADAHLVCQWAQIQPRIIYEEKIQRDGLDGIEVLVMPTCDVLPKSVYDKVKAFQDRGGIIVADQHLTPALTPDIYLKAYRRMGKPDLDKKNLQYLAKKLRKELAPVHTWFADSSSQDVVVRRRRYGEADYVFAINDKRTYGAYVGHHRKVMEKGLPNAATISVKRRGTVYDLVRHRRVPTKFTGKGMAWDAKFGPGAGKVYLVMAKAVGKVKVTGPGTLARGGEGRIAAAVVDTRGRAPSAMLPVQVEILDPKGRPAEGSGYYGAKNGVVELSFTAAPNDISGKWTVRVTCLASGKVGEAVFSVK